jgi:hypothetical protein
MKTFLRMDVKMMKKISLRYGSGSAVAGTVGFVFH